MAIAAAAADFRKVRCERWAATTTTAVDGTTRLTWSAAPRLYWVLPSIGSCPLGGELRVEAAGYQPMVVPMPASCDWSLFGEPTGKVTVRLPR